MKEVDIKQQELDLAEQQMLTDIFGGYTPDKLVVHVGFLRFDLSPKVQKVLNDFEKIEILENSIVNCWQGVFEIKKERELFEVNPKS